MKRRPDRLTGMRNSLGRRVIEPESFVSSSCVGDQFQNLKRHPVERMASARPTAGKGLSKRAAHAECEPPGKSEDWLAGLDTNVRTGGKLYSIRPRQGKSRIPSGHLLPHVDLEFTRDS